MRILSVDVGGTHVKVLRNGLRTPRKADSGPTLTARAMVRAVTSLAADWEYDVVSIGYPGPVLHGRIVSEPHNLGGGWMGFDFARAFHRPVKVINDAAMQALGSYRGRRMLFLGLGTGLGSALVWEKYVLPLELGELPYHHGKIIEQYLGKPGLARLGGKTWQRDVCYAVTQLKKSFIADYVVLGGGNAKKLDALPEGVELGNNRNAFLGGVRLWQTAPGTRRPKWEIL